jgi:hypothetical protein
MGNLLSHCLPDHQNVMEDWSAMNEGNVVLARDA